MDLLSMLTGKLYPLLSEEDEIIVMQSPSTHVKTFNKYNSCGGVNDERRCTSTLGTSGVNNMDAPPVGRGRGAVMPSWMTHANINNLNANTTGSYALGTTTGSDFVIIRQNNNNNEEEDKKNSRKRFLNDSDDDSDDADNNSKSSRTSTSSGRHSHKGEKKKRKKEKKHGSKKEKKEHKHKHKKEKKEKKKSSKEKKKTDKGL